MQHITTTVNNLREQGKPVIGCFPLYPPLELFHSLSITPLILWELKDAVDQTIESDRHIQTFTCSVARCLMQILLEKNGPEFDALFMYNACDTLRNLPELIDDGFSDRRKTQNPIFKLHIPAVPLEQTDGRPYLRQRIETLIKELESHFKVQFSGEAFKESTIKYRGLRQLYLEAEDLVAQGRLSFAEFSQIGCKGYHLPLDVHVAELQSLIQNSSATPVSGTRIMLSGIITPPSDIIEAMEESGLQIVCNDLASLGRSYMYNPEPSDDPLSYYVDFYENHTPCTTLLPSADDRIQYLLDMAENKDVSGVIFIGEKFCEHEYFEFPYLIKKFKERGIQVLQLEFSQDDKENIGPFKTRIEAFAEIIQGQYEGGKNGTYD